MSDDFIFWSYPGFVRKFYDPKKFFETTSPVTGRVDIRFDGLRAGYIKTNWMLEQRSNLSHWRTAEYTSRRIAQAQYTLSFLGGYILSNSIPAWMQP